MANGYDYFASMMKDEKLLNDHGFDHWPSDEELMRYLMQTNDRINALESALGLQATRDFRGRWMAVKTCEVVA